MDYRFMKPEDISQVAVLEQEIFSVPWTKQAFLDSLNNPDTIYLVAQEEEKICGYCGIYLLYEVGEISNVAVKAEKRNQGIAGCLLKKMIAEAAKKGVSDIMLEVRESNLAAISLYQKLGFSKEGIRRNYYEKPQENALILWKRGISITE